MHSLRYIFTRTTILAALLLSALGLSLVWVGTTNGSSIYDAQGVSVGATYYGGEYSGSGWIIDNNNQCSGIEVGEFTAASLDATKSSDCDDDSGLAYLNNIPLHNRVSFAELSNNTANPDYSALGNLPAYTRLQIQYNGKCLIAEKLDVGTGGSNVGTYTRAIDLWWQTARSIGFTNGFDVMQVKYVDQSTPLTPLGTTSDCSPGKVKQASDETTQSQQQKEVAPAPATTDFGLTNQTNVTNDITAEGAKNNAPLVDTSPPQSEYEDGARADENQALNKVGMASTLGPLVLFSACAVVLRRIR